MTDALTCSYCGAPITALVKGRCPHCDTIIDRDQGEELVIDARGDIWRMVLTSAGRKPRKVVKLLEHETGRTADEAKALVGAVQPNLPQIVAEGIPGTRAMELFTALVGVGAEGYTEHRYGDGWKRGASWPA